MTADSATEVEVGMREVMVNFRVRVKSEFEATLGSEADWLV